MHKKHNGKTLKDLLEQSVIGTSSTRRAVQLSKTFPKLKFESLGDNLERRFDQLDNDTKYDAIIKAEVALVRMGKKDRIAQVLSTEHCLHAVDQGAVAVKCRKGDNKILDLLREIHDQDTALACIAERAFCQKMLQLSLTGAVFTKDGKQYVKDSPPPKKLSKEPAKHKSATNGHLFADIVPGDIDEALCRTAEEVGTELANHLLHNKEEAKMLDAAKKVTSH